TAILSTLPTPCHRDRTARRDDRRRLPAPRLSAVVGAGGAVVGSLAGAPVRPLRPALGEGASTGARPGPSPSAAPRWSHEGAGQEGCGGAGGPVGGGSFKRLAIEVQATGVTVLVRPV